VLIIGTKSDLDEEREVTFEEGQTYGNENDLTFLETSSKENKGVDEAFLIMANEIMCNMSPEQLDGDVRRSFKIRGMPLEPEAGDEDAEHRPVMKKKKKCCKSV
jgi:Ras-related protein Rab-14